MPKELSPSETLLWELVHSDHWKQLKAEAQAAMQNYATRALGEAVNEFGLHERDRYSAKYHAIEDFVSLIETTVEGFNKQDEIIDDSETIY